MSDVPESVTLEFFRTSGEPVRYIDLGVEFLTESQVDSAKHERPVKVAIARKKSKAGNAFYEYAQNGLPLPDGLNTFLKVEGSIIPFGKTRPSKKGYPTREGQTQVLIGGRLYNVTAYLTEAKMPFYVKVVLHKKPEGGAASLQKAQKAPRGGRFI